MDQSTIDRIAALEERQQELDPASNEWLEIHYEIAALEGSDPDDAEFWD